jgi:RNA 2',3'-cyclic 3'-phosphodiesterase
MRLFLATAFPEDVLRALSDRVSPIKIKLPPASWVRPETQHLTFAFLGEQPESLIDDLAPQVERELKRVPKFEGALRGCGFFPNPRHARIGWIGVDPEERFVAIARAVRAAVGAIGIEADRAEFKPHLTVMRMREGWPPMSIETFNKALREFRSTPFAVDGVTLYSSELNPKGAIHTPLKRFALGVAA